MRFRTRRRHHRLGSQGGYAMAALLVMVAVLTVLMSAAMPVWRRDAQREKEEELVFRGQQYVRAIRLYQAKMRTFPPSVDVLVQGRYLRKKFKDPITNSDFVPIGAAGGAAGQIGQAGQPGSAVQPEQTGLSTGSGQRGASAPTTTQMGQNPGTPTGGLGGGNVAGGIIGVVSKSKDESVRIYQGRTHYNEWQFVYVNAQPGGPGGVGGRGTPGGRGGQGVPGAPGGGRGRRIDERDGQFPGGPFPGRGVPPGGPGRGQPPVIRPPGGGPGL